jgi:hypothetical protein
MDDMDVTNTQAMAAPMPKVSQASAGSRCWFVYGPRLEAYPWLLDEHHYVYKRKGMWMSFFI